MSKNSNLNIAKDTKNDEFYTRLYDIESELSNYKQHFKNKIIYCNCDDPDKSNFVKYFEDHFTELELKDLISTYYTSYALSYETRHSSIFSKILLGDGDFRSDECVEILKQADIIVTNPPFSLAREFIALLMKYNKKFIIVGDLNWITYKEVFPYIMNNQIWLGNNYIKEFIQPDGTLKKFGNKLWFTNLDYNKRHERIILSTYYFPDNYYKYDNYDAIECSKLEHIPCDYYGVIGVPITYLTIHNPEQFEILGFGGGCGWDEQNKIKTTKRYINPIQHNRDLTTQNGDKVNTGCTIKCGSEINNRTIIKFDYIPNEKYYTADNSDGYLLRTYGRIFIRRIDK
jgi:hypothetical protein